MDRGAWRATVNGVARVGQDLAAKTAKGVVTPSHHLEFSFFDYFSIHLFLFLIANRHFFH